MTTYDLAIVGSGMGGSLLAMAARKMGKSVLLIERGSHPRFAIGESTSPLMNLLLEELSHRYDLPRLLPLTQWGTWKSAYPSLGVGLKRGFSYYGHQPGRPFANLPDRSDQLLVAASPADPCADTHWLRADTDRWLMEEAVALGADYVDHTDVESADARDGIWRLALAPGGRDVRARLLVDASGPGGFLHRRGGWRDVGFPGYPETRALYSHFKNVKFFASLIGGSESAPYPPDRAALHHVFPGGWMWCLRFDDETVSAGVSVEASLADELGLHEKEAGWKRLLKRFPSIGEQFAEAVAVQPWVYAPKVAFRTERASGVEEGAPWGLLPSAAGFIDPFYSTGMTLTLLGVGRLAKILESAEPGLTDLREYEARTFEDLDWTAAFIAAHYRSFGSFSHFSALTMYYFAAASYSELARRFGVAAPRFLAGDDPAFREGIARCARDMHLPPTEFSAAIASDIAHKNVAGLVDPSKGNWYEVDLEDIALSAEKLGFTEAKMREIIAEAPWAKCE